MHEIEHIYKETQKGWTFVVYNRTQKNSSPQKVMNSAQKIYYDLVLSDYDVLGALETKPTCHQLHYLQMVTEKLARCFFDGKVEPVERTHTGFRRFIRMLERLPHGLHMRQPYGHLSLFAFFAPLRENL